MADATLLMYLLWAVKWALVIGLAGFLAYIVLSIVVRTVVRFGQHMKIIIAGVVHHSSAWIADGVVYLIALGLYVAHRKLMITLEPLKERLAGVRYQRDTEKISFANNPEKEARYVLGLADGFSENDLTSRADQLKVRLSPDAGGTAWLLAKIEWAVDILSPDPVKEAKNVMGMPSEFTMAELKRRYLDLMKRAHVDTGGTDGLAMKVIWAYEILKREAR